jgi:zinc/manganese transport system substrate-binding protein
MEQFFRAILALLATGLISLSPVAAAAADKLRVVATFSVIADMVNNIGGDHVDLTTIVGLDGDTELYAPTVVDIPKVANARILFMNGLSDDFEPWLEPLLKQARFSGTKVIVSRGVRALSAEDEHPMGGKPRATVLDQHAWLDPRNGIIYAKNITDTLARIDPANADAYHSRASSYTQQLRALDSGPVAKLTRCPSSSAACSRHMTHCSIWRLPSRLR